MYYHSRTKQTPYGIEVQNYIQPGFFITMREGNKIGKVANKALDVCIYIYSMYNNQQKYEVWNKKRDELGMLLESGAHVKFDGQLLKKHIWFSWPSDKTQIIICNWIPHTNVCRI